MRSIECRDCGGVNEVADTGDLPRCMHCGHSLLTGILREPPPDDHGAGTGGETDGPTGTGEGGGAGGPGITGSRRDEAPPPCRCEGGGGPMPDDPTTCFQCGGRLPAARRESGAERGSTSAGADLIESADPADPAESFGPTTRTCTLFLADGRQVPVGDGVLVSRCDPATATDMRVVAVATRTVSRKHAWLRVAGGKVEVLDLGSTNGTWVAGRRIEPLRPVEVAPRGSVEISFSQALRATLTFD